MDQTVETLASGQIARLRQLTYLIDQVVKPKRVADSTLVRLSCVVDDNQAQRHQEELLTGKSSEKPVKEIKQQKKRKAETKGVKKSADHQAPQKELF